MRYTGRGKEGDILRCVRWDGLNYVAGTHYKVCSDPKGIIKLLGLMNTFGHWCAESWELGDFELLQPHATAMAAPPITYANAQTGRMKREPQEDALMRAWLAVPSGCCPKCAAPLPCSYHPDREKAAEFAKAYQDPDDIEF